MFGFTAKREKPKYAVGVSVIVTDDDARVLLGKRLAGHPDIIGKLCTPGGRIEENEDRFAAARREFLEETGADLGAVEVIGFREHFRYGEHYFMIYLHAWGAHGEIRNTEPTRCGGWAYYKVDDALREGTTEPDEILRTAEFAALARRADRLGLH